MRFRGTIIPGQKIGRTLGFPTLNFEIPRDFTLAEGVYASRIKSPLFQKPRSNQIIPLSQRGKRAERGGGFESKNESTLQSVLFYGHRHTFDDKKALEVHVLDQDFDETPTEAEVQILDKIRENRKFDSADELKQQIEKDCLKAKQILKLK